MKNGKMALLAALVFGVAGQAQAGFAVVTEQSGASPAADRQQSVAEPSAPTSAGLFQKGEPDAMIPIVKGFAKEISLLTALKQIVPKGWKAKRSGNLDVSMPVSWRGEGRSWTEVLDTMARAHGIAASIDWGKKELTVATAGDQAVAVPERSSASAVQAPAPAANVAEESRPAERASWVLKPEMTLKENVTVWAKTAGWEVSWGAVDYPVANQVVLHGNFDAEDGPISQLAQAYSAAEQPLTFSFWTNKVIRVENAAYKQSVPSDQRPNHRAMN